MTTDWMWRGGGRGERKAEGNAAAGNMGDWKDVRKRGGLWENKNEISFRHAG